jgi:hypothetical protein
MVDGSRSTQPPVASRDAVVGPNVWAGWSAVSSEAPRGRDSADRLDRGRSFGEPSFWSADGSFSIRRGASTGFATGTRRRFDSTSGCRVRWRSRRWR